MLILYSAEHVADQVIRPADRIRCAWRAARPSSTGSVRHVAGEIHIVLHPKVSVLLVGIRLIPGHRAKIRQHPFNGIPHGVEFRVLERVGEIQVHRNIAVSNVQRPIRVAETRTYSEAGPRVAVRLAAGWVAVYSNKSGRVAAYSYRPFQKLRRNEILPLTCRSSSKVLPSATFHTVQPLICLSSPVSSILTRRNAPDGLPNISPLGSLPQRRNTSFLVLENESIMHPAARMKNQHNAISFYKLEPYSSKMPNRTHLRAANPFVLAST